MADTNMFQNLEREKSSPAVNEMEVLNTPISGRTSESAPMIQVKSGQLISDMPVAQQEQHAPPTPGRDAPSNASASKQENVDAENAPGKVSYAQAAKEHKDTAGSKAKESAQAAQDSAVEAGRAAEAKTAQIGQEASEAAQEAKAKVGEAAQVTKDKAGQAAHETRAKAEEVGEVTREKAREVAEATKIKAGEASQAAKELGSEAVDAAKEFALVAGDKASQVTSAAGEQLSEAVEYVKEHVHLPRVERAESTPEEREARALLDEARALGEGTSGGTSYYQPRPKLYAPPATVPSAVPANTVAPAAPRGPADMAAITKEVAQDAVNDMIGSASWVGREALEAEKHHRAVKTASATGTPDELILRAQREEVSAKSPLQALTEKAKEAVEYVRESIMPTTHEKAANSAQHATVSAKQAGDNAAEGTKDAVRKAEVKTEGAAQEAKHKAEGAAQAASSTGHKVSEQATGLVHTVEDKASEAYKATADTVSGAYHSVADKASQTYNATADAASHAYTAVADTVQEAEEKAKWTVEHTKEKLHETQEEWQKEMQPRTAEEAVLSHGEVPTNTEDILKARVVAE